MGAQAGPRTRAICGKCGRTLARFTLDDWNNLSRTQLAWDHITWHAELHGIDVPATDAGLQRRSYPCHKRCGARYVIRVDRLAPKVMESLQAHKDIVLGVDL